MAWAQRNDAATGRFIAESYSDVLEESDLEQTHRCAACARLIVGDAVIVKRERYCSIDCVLIATRSKDVPGQYLG
jgi:hypothetical protein